MRVKFVLLLTVVFAFTSSCNKQKQIDFGSGDVEFISLPLSLNVRLPLGSEKLFDQYNSGLKDTIFLPARDLQLDLSQPLSNQDDLDVRIKVTFLNHRGEKEKLLLARTGVFYYSGVVYMWNEDTKRLVWKIDSLRRDNGKPVSADHDLVKGLK